VAIPSSVLAQLKIIYPDLEVKKVDPSDISPWKNPLTNPFFYLLVLNEKYGMDYLDFEPETLDAILKKYDPSNVNMSTLSTIKACIKSDNCWNNVAAFNNAVISLNGEIPAVELLESVTPAEMDFTVDTLRRIDKKREFSQDVLGYIEQNNRMYSGFEGLGENIIKSRSENLLRDLEWQYLDRK
jgi:hypothetical protein